MARLYKQKYWKTQTVKDSNGNSKRVPVMDNDGRPIVKETKKWQGEFTDLSGKRCTVSLLTNREESQKALDKLVDLLKKAENNYPVSPHELSPLIEDAFYKAVAGSKIVSASLAHNRKPLKEHVEDWRLSLISDEATEDYVNLSVNRVKDVLEGTRSAYWHELDASKVKSYLHKKRKTVKTGRKGLSKKSSNHYVKHLKQFCNWMVENRRAAESPLACLELLNTEDDERHSRRALNEDELRMLITTTVRQPKRFGLTGAERALLYRLAVETGLRANELRSLTPESFDLDSPKPSVTVSAAFAKNSREDIQPIRPTLAQDLRQLILSCEPGTCVFKGTRMTLTDKTADMIREDLEAAKIPYRDHAGRVADFHSLRHTFITNLAKSGVFPKDAQALARHSSIGLTMDCYTHVCRDELSGKLDGLPDLSKASGREQQKKTGTYDAPEIRGKKSTQNLTEKLTETTGMRLSSDDIEDESANQEFVVDDLDTKTKNIAVDSQRSPVTTNDTGDLKTGSGWIRTSEGVRQRVYSPLGESIIGDESTTYNAKDADLLQNLLNLPRNQPDLMAVVHAWSTLPDHIKSSILTLVDSAKVSNDINE